MENIKLDVPVSLRSELIEAVSKIQDKYYVAQAAETNINEKKKHLEKFMAAGDMLGKLELWLSKESK